MFPARGSLKGVAHRERRFFTIFNVFFDGSVYIPVSYTHLSEGKHYNVAISHAAKKLVRLIFAMQRSGTVSYTHLRIVVYGNSLQQRVIRTLGRRDLSGCF